MDGDLTSKGYHKNRQYVLDYLHLLKKDNLDLYKLVKKCVSTAHTKTFIKTVLSNLHIQCSLNYSFYTISNILF